MGFSYGLNSFTAAVLGGIGNLNGAMLGGVFIGILAAMSDGYLDARWTPIVIFGTLNLVLIIRPSGILGQDLAERA
jgi:branched-chain amino acid transport system permease protein